jgi:hypothetical protein
MAGDGRHLLVERVDAAAQLHRQVCQDADVEPDARKLHLRQDRRQRRLDLVVEELQVLPFELRLEVSPEQRQRRRLRAEEAGRGPDLNIARQHRLLAAAEHLDQRLQGAAQPLVRELTHRRDLGPGVAQIRRQRYVEPRGRGETARTERQLHQLERVRDQLEPRPPLAQHVQQCVRGLEGLARSAQGDIGRPVAGRGGQRDPGDGRAPRLRVLEHEADRDRAGPSAEQLGQPPRPTHNLGLDLQRRGLLAGDLRPRELGLPWGGGRGLEVERGLGAAGRTGDPGAGGAALDVDGLLLIGAHRARQARHQGAEVVLLEEVAHRHVVVLLEHRGFGVEPHRDVAHDGGQPLAQRQLLGAGAKRVGQSPGRHGVERGQQALDRAVLLEQLDRGLLPHPRHAGDVVGGVALERLEVRHLRGLQPVPRPHRVEVVADGVRYAPPHSQRVHGRADQLQRVEVAGEDAGAQAQRLGLRRQRADDVVRLEALIGVDGEVQRGHHLAHDRELRDQLLGRLRPLGLVLRVLLVAEGLGGMVEGGGHQVVAGQGVEQHRGEAEGRVGQPALAVGQGREGEEGAVDQRVAVDQQQALAGVGHAIRF